MLRSRIAPQRKKLSAKNLNYKYTIVMFYMAEFVDDGARAQAEGLHDNIRSLQDDIKKLEQKISILWTYNSLQEEVIRNLLANMGVSESTRNKISDEITGLSAFRVFRKSKFIRENEELNLRTLLREAGKNFQPKPPEGKKQSCPRNKSIAGSNPHYKY